MAGNADCGHLDSCEGDLPWNGVGCFTYPHVGHLTWLNFEGWIDGVGDFLDSWSTFVRQLVIDKQTLIISKYKKC